MQLKVPTFLKRLKRKKKEFEILHKQPFLLKILLFLKRGLVDVFKAQRSNKFNDYGLTTFVGRQGSGKTISLVERLETIRKEYPDVRILTNFGYKYEDKPLTDWQQLLDDRNDAGIVFAIDEIQNEFDVYDARNFNLDILKVITQQRKQGIKVLATSQVFTRVSKPLREQTFEVVECYTIMGRWTWQKCFDADDYNMVIDNPDPDKKIKVQRKWRKNFVHTDTIRNLFDSYAVIKTMKKLAREGKRRAT